jgi:nucleotide-binding universal stress UspA family protein
MERLLVGLDGSGAADGALQWSADVARRARLQLVAARVFTATQAELSPDIDADLHAQQRREVEQWAANAGPAGAIEAVLLDGDPPDALLAAAVDRRADLLVVGGHHSGKLAHLDASSVAEQLAHRTTLPLTVVPHAGAAAAPLTHIVVGVDGSEGSDAAVDFVADLAARMAVGVTAVLAFDPLVETVPETDPDSWRHEAERAVHRSVAGMGRAGVAVEIDIDRDVRPEAAIARALEAHPGAIACIGARPLSDVTGLRVGRIFLPLLDRKTSPVMVVPPESKR